MIKNIKLFNFQGVANCKDINRQSTESFLKINYLFESGNSYGLISDFGLGSWGLATAIGGRCAPDYSGNIFIDGNKVTISDMSKVSCFVRENLFEGINSEQDLMSPKKCIENALDISHLDFSFTQIKKMFFLSDERFEKNLSLSSGEIWTISIAVNFALGKDVFIYPWLNVLDFDVYDIHCKLGIIDLLKRYGKIVIAPSSKDKRIKKLCDHKIVFKREKYLFK